MGGSGATELVAALSRDTAAQLRSYTSNAISTRRNLTREKGGMTR